MQRKNRILKRRGMAMIMAIFFIVIIAVIMAVIMQLTATTTKKTENLYLHEQALGLTRSATEYALLAVSGHNHNALQNCINRIDAQYPSATNPIFDINITLRYVGFGNINIANDGQCVDYIRNIQTPESNGSILMDVVVTSSPDLNLSEEIRYFRRTMQKM
ncbi:MAG: type II secretion system protein [Sulfuricurvum sp.]|uniref:type II secretion system protein n=1 Tax=Sulfuricurvum sp. TaxID=2025608 RepID=UPI0025EE9695|nr:type II secretion system protein [Sulfuricurvum sp.]MBV5320070.1 type II secretion system protein [Sulfuricurvum sp.]